MKKTFVSMLQIAYCDFEFFLKDRLRRPVLMLLGLAITLGAVYFAKSMDMEHERVGARARLATLAVICWFYMASRVGRVTAMIEADRENRVFEHNFTSRYPALVIFASKYFSSSLAGYLTFVPIWVITMLGLGLGIHLSGQLFAGLLGVEMFAAACSFLLGALAVLQEKSQHIVAFIGIGVGTVVLKNQLSGGANTPSLDLPVLSLPFKLVALNAGEAVKLTAFDLLGGATVLALASALFVTSVRLAKRKGHIV